MVDLHAYVPVAGGIRIAIGIFSYLDAMTFGINADFDAFPDIDVLAEGIDAGMDELCALSSEPGARAAT
jgi:diacylglycerol O-acyltransferase